MPDPCGYYLNCDDAVCKWCVTVEEVESSYAPIWSWDESDCPVHCCRCDDLLPVGLTEDGRQYVNENLPYDGEAPTSIQQMWLARWPELAA